MGAEQLDALREELAAGLAEVDRRAADLTREIEGMVTAAVEAERQLRAGGEQTVHRLESSLGSMRKELFDLIGEGQSTALEHSEVLRRTEQELVAFKLDIEVRKLLRDNKHRTKESRRRTRDVWIRRPVPRRRRWGEGLVGAISPMHFPLWRVCILIDPLQRGGRGPCAPFGRCQSRFRQVQPPRPYTAVAESWLGQCCPSRFEGYGRLFPTDPPCPPGAHRAPLALYPPPTSTSAAVSPVSSHTDIPRPWFCFEARPSPPPNLRYGWPRSRNGWRSWPNGSAPRRPSSK